MSESNLIVASGNYEYDSIIASGNYEHGSIIASARSEDITKVINTIGITGPIINDFVTSYSQCLINNQVNYCKFCLLFIILMFIIYVDYIY
jgi:hypothetical protein